METLEPFQQNRRVIEDFTTRTLAAIPSVYGRLVYTASLRELDSGRYCHEGLTTVYTEEAVQQALHHCHTQLFLRVLEMPLEEQEWDLRACLGALEGEFWEKVERWQESEFQHVFLPAGVPDYLEDLFSSNLRALLGLLAEQRAIVRPAA